MPQNIFLIGDSTRLDAEPDLVGKLGERYLEKLGERYRISSPPQSCESSVHVKDNICTLIDDSQVDILHINCGLHDLRMDPDSKEYVTPLKEYQNNLEQIFVALDKLDIKVIWATTTPIIESWHNAKKPWLRFQRDITAYNKVSIAVAKNHGAHINDLYTHLTNKGLDSLLFSDGVHFNPLGRMFIAEKMMQKIVSLTE